MTKTPLPQSPGPARDLVFISYSHRDRDWLERLLIFFKPYARQNLKIWADPYIKIGDKWRRDISAALSHTSVAVLLVTPDFLASDFIYDEELPPLLQGADNGSITLFPVPVSAADHETSPLAHYQFAHPPDDPLDRMRRPDRNPVFVRLVKQIVAAAQKAAPDPATAEFQTGQGWDASTGWGTPLGQHIEAALAPVAPTGRMGALHGVPGQRPNYLRRQDYLDRLKQVVLGATDRAVGITGAISRIGLHGMGGIGKTVLAIDFVNDDEVQRAFPDGIFWLTLGQTIEPLRLQGELAGFLTGEVKAYATVNEARDQLRKLFDGKSCLLVLDDLWHARDAEPFDVLGPRSRLLVTTRDADLLVAVGARELPLDVLSEELALELLASWSGQARNTLPPGARKVAEGCGYLPLALALAGARVQGGARWDDLLSALQRGRLEFLDHPYGSVFSSLRLSTDALPETEGDRYFELVVFPEDAKVPVEAVCTLWDHTGRMERQTSEDLLLRLHRRALLIRSEDGGHISFHDLQHDFLRLNIASLVEAHTAVVDAYRAAAASGWASGPDDGYFFQHLLQHLAAADRLNEVKALLSNYDWLAAKLRATDITAVLADYDLIARDLNLTLVQQALRLSVPALVRDRSQLPGQLLGRLRGPGGPEVQMLLAMAEQESGQTWLRPRFASLTPPGGPLRQILVGHRGPITAVAVLADGRRALSGSEDKTLRLWDLATGETLRTLEGHSNSVAAAAVLADGRRALSGSWDKTLRLWDLATGETLCTLEGHTSWVSSAAVLADGSRALSGSWDKTLRLWDLATGETLRTLEGRTRGVSAVAVLADGRRALSGSWDTTLRLWDLATGETLRTLEGHTRWVSAVAVLADGSRALSGSYDNTLRLWDLATGATLRTREGHTRRVSAVAVLADGSRALSGSSDNTLRLWDLATGETLRTLQGHTGSVTALAVLADGSRALSGSADKTLRLWDLATGETLRTLQGHTSGVTTVAVFADGGRALSGSDDKTLRLWDLVTGETLRTHEGHTDGINAVVVTADGSRALSGSDDKTLRVWDLATGETLRTLQGHTSYVHTVAVLADGSRALSGSLDHTLRLWDLETGEALRVFEAHTAAVAAVSALADGCRALSGSADHTLRLWDLATGECLAEFTADAAIFCVASAREDLIVAGSADGKFHILEIREP
jgi:WD40 repeat protein